MAGGGGVRQLVIWTSITANRPVICTQSTEPRYSVYSMHEAGLAPSQDPTPLTRRETQPKPISGSHGFSAVDYMRYARNPKPMSQNEETVVSHVMHIVSLVSLERRHRHDHKFAQTRSHGVRWVRTHAERVRFVECQNSRLTTLNQCVK